MIFRFATLHARTEECAWIVAPVFAALGPMIRRPNAANRFAVTPCEVLFAT